MVIHTLGTYMMTMPDILKAAHSVTPRVFWKETSPFKGMLLSNKTGSFRRPLDIDHAAKRYCEQGMCTYVQFPELPSTLLDENGIPPYWDNLHFSSGALYDYWNRCMVSKLGLPDVSALHAIIAD